MQRFGNQSENPTPLPPRAQSRPPSIATMQRDLAILSSSRMAVETGRRSLSTVNSPQPSDFVSSRTLPPQIPAGLRSGSQAVPFPEAPILGFQSASYPASER
jgi:hypothetical protein